MSQATIREVLDTASPHLRRDAEGVRFALVCTVDEGTACRFTCGKWTDGLPAALAARLVDELGWKEVEHAARRQVVLRVRVPGGDPARASAECDRGDGFGPIEVTEG